MGLQVEKLEKNTVKMTAEVPAEQFEEAIKTAYNKNKDKLNIPGFKKGKAPLVTIERMYSVGVLFEDVANIVLDVTYGGTADESRLEIVSRPETDVVQIERGKNSIYTATVAVKPEVALGDYKGLEVEEASAEVIDEEARVELRKVQEQNSRLLTVENRAAADGDQVTIDSEGLMDGVALVGDKGEDYPLTIGSHSFIGDFEGQLIGHNIDDDCEVNVKFSEDYQAVELTGKDVMPKVATKEIRVKELLELNDEFASEVSEPETLDEYEADARAKFTESKQRQAVTENENRVVEKAVSNASMKISEPMVEGQLDNMVNDYVRRIQGQGISLEQYMQFTGMTMAALREQMRPQTIKRIETKLVLEAIAKTEAIEIADETVEEELKKMAESYRMEVEQVKDYMDEQGLAQMKEDLAVQEAVDMMIAEVKLV